MILDFFIPSRHLVENQIKTKTFVYVLLFCIFGTIILFGLNQTIGFQSNFPFLLLASELLILLLFFKYSGSFLITGNLIAGSACYVLFSLGLTTGGIFSEDIHCLYLVPLLAFLIVGIKSGLFWLTVSIALAFYSFHLADTIPTISMYRNQTNQFDKTYYLINTIVNLLVVSSLLTVLHYRHKNQINKHKINQEELEFQTEQLQETKDKLLKSNAALDRYAYSTAHDLKQPIRTIHSFSGLLAKELEKDKPRKEKENEYLKIILNSSANMNKMVNDLLDYSTLSQIDIQKFDLVDLNEVMSIVIINLKESIRSTKTTFGKITLPTILGNKIQLIQLFQNLVYNAIKFKTKDRAPIINIGFREEDRAHILSVSDNGIGINNIYISAIFIPFKRLHGGNEYEGSGIGLATCSKIVENHDGKIWADSIKGEGSTFYFSVSKNLKKV